MNRETRCACYDEICQGFKDPEGKIYCWNSITKNGVLTLQATKIS